MSSSWDFLWGGRGFGSIPFVCCILSSACVEPSALLTISFQLSFLRSVVHRNAMGREKKNPRKREVPRPADYVLHLKKLPHTHTRGITRNSPLVAYYFHYFSVISPLQTSLMNTFCVGFVLLSLLLIAAFSFICTGYYPFQSLIALASDISIKGLKCSAAVPLADIRIPAFPPWQSYSSTQGLWFIFCPAGKRYVLAIPLDIN